MRSAKYNTNQTIKFAFNYYILILNSIYFLFRILIIFNFHLILKFI